MEVRCRGCGGCCLDWRPLAPVEEHERRGPHRPLDDVYNLVPLSRDDVRSLVDADLGAAMTPRLWRADDESRSVAIDGESVAAIGDKPAFFVGLRKVPKPVAPFDTDPSWLPTCVFLDPTTLQCRVHDSEAYPEECAAYPGHNLSVGAETECERVETHFEGPRLLDDTPPADDPGPLFGPQAVGQKVFVYPEPEELKGVIDRAVAGELTEADRAQFIATATASAPGTTTIERHYFEETLETVRANDGWVRPAIRAWQAKAASGAPNPELAEEFEDARGAPPTPGWGPEDS